MLLTKKKLDTLTTLRFFAAGMIVFLHLNQILKLTTAYFPYCYAITFFFILSGFILCYSYPSLDSIEERKKFYIARFARIWPAHLTYFLLTCFLVLFGVINTIGNKKIAILNLTMLHAWIPSPKLYFSFNSPSWSISTEFFFYLCFPFIIYRWKNTWVWKGLVILLIPFIFMHLISYFEIPSFTNALSSNFTDHGFLYIHPLARLPEFFLGICSASLWVKYRSKFVYNFFVGTILEIGIIFLFLVNAIYYHKITDMVVLFIPNYISEPFSVWVNYTGIFSSISIILLIMIFANSNGLISRILSHPWFVFLGEISFSIYLSHYIFLNIHQYNLSIFSDLSNAKLIGIFLASTFLTSCFVWFFIEQPLRNLINKKAQKNLLFRNCQLPT